MTKRRIELGEKGEAIATNYLIDQGYLIIERNYRCRLGEIDIIAKKGNLLVFIEVRAKVSLKFGRPEESITTRKAKKIRQVAEMYLSATRSRKFDISFDFISVLINSEGEILQIEHYQNAF